MIGLVVRIFLAVMVLAALVILFAYAFIAAVIITPFVLLFLYLMGRRADVQWWAVRPAEHWPPKREPPVIDHDPNDLPPRRDD